MTVKFIHHDDMASRTFLVTYEGVMLKHEIENYVGLCDLKT